MFSAFEEPDQVDGKRVISLHGKWQTKNKKVKIEIFQSGEKIRFSISSKDKNSPHEGSFNLKHPYFEYEGKKYKLYFEGNHPKKMTLLWKKIEEDGFKQSLTFTREGAE